MTCPNLTSERFLWPIIIATDRKLKKTITTIEKNSSLKVYYNFFFLAFFQKTLQKYHWYLEESSCSLNVEKNVWERSDSVGVSSHHHVRKTDVVVHRDLKAKTGIMSKLKNKK